MGKTIAIALAVVLGIVLCGLLLVVPQYNGLVKLDEQVKAAWANVETTYQRRADLVPNLVKTVEGSANFERGTLEAVVKARADATRPEINIAGSPTAAQLQQFQAAQGELSGALSRLLAVVENYPDLKTTQAFQDLMAQLEGTENRIGVARKDYNDTAERYNQSRRSFPMVVVAALLGFAEKPYYQAAPGSENAPEVDFGGLTGGGK